MKLLNVHEQFTAEIACEQTEKTFVGVTPLRTSFRAEG
jgi:hypothetical protein